MTATSATTAALLQAILDDPAATDRRLVYADWLDEHDGVEESPCDVCSPYKDDPENPWRGEAGYRPERDPASGRHEGGWSNCKTCNCGGRDYIRPGIVRKPNGYAARSEFIRVGCELVHLGECQRLFAFGLSCGCRFCNGGGLALQRREHALLVANEPAWLPGVRTRRQVEACKRCKGRKWISRRISDDGVGRSTATLDCPDCTPEAIASAPDVTWSRGFVAGVTCRLEQWVGAICEVCNGRGRRCSGPCRGTGRTPGLRAALRLHPVERVETEKRPRRFDQASERNVTDTSWNWLRGNGSLPSALPDDVLALMKVFTYDTEQLALDALSAALLLMARPVSG